MFYVYVFHKLLLPIRISFYWFLWTAFNNLSMISFDFELLIHNRKYSKFSFDNTPERGPTMLS